MANDAAISVPMGINLFYFVILFYFFILIINILFDSYYLFINYIYLDMQVLRESLSDSNVQLNKVLDELGIFGSVFFFFFFGE
jgi:hypothetical protein